MYVSRSSFLKPGAAVVASALTMAAVGSSSPWGTTHAAGAVAVVPARAIAEAGRPASDGRPYVRSNGGAGAVRSSTPFGTLPMFFEPRRSGDVDGFVARGQGYNVAISPAGASLTLRSGSGLHSTVSLLVDGASHAARIEGEDLQPGVVHRYAGARDQWQADVRTFGRVVVRDVRPGVDVVYYGNQQQLEYDFIVAPGANPADAGMIVDGADRVEIDAATGDLLLHVDGRILRQQAPIAYQNVEGTRTPVVSAFTYDAAARRVGVTVGRYDMSRPLVIDPVLVYSSWFGGLSEEAILALEVDADGFIYAMGFSADEVGFPTTPGVFQPAKPGPRLTGDYFVTKFNPAGTQLVYSTYFGSDGDEPASTFNLSGDLAVAAGGVVHIVGETASETLPTTPDAADSTFGAGNGGDAFYARLSPTGTLLYSTYIGGSADDFATGVDIDAAGNAYIVGFTASDPAGGGFPITGNAYRGTRSGSNDLFLAKINAAGQFAYVSYFGGSGNELFYGADVVVDETGKAVIGSETTSGNLPTTPNARQGAFAGGTYDAFIAQIDTNVAGLAGLLYCSYVGGSDTDTLYGLAMDAAGHVYVTGDTRSLNFPTTAGAYKTTRVAGTFNQDLYVAKYDLTQTGNASLVYATYLGGTDLDNVFDIAVDAQGRAHVVGNTRSDDFPLVGAVQTVRYQSIPFVSILGASGATPEFSTLLGANSNGNALFAVAVNANGETYVGGATNTDRVRDAARPDGFPLVNALQNVYGGGDRDAVLQKLGYSVDLSLTKVANVGVLLPGQNVTFTLQVVNPSSDPASGVVVTDSLPAGLEFVSCTSDLGGICGGAGKDRSVSFAQLAPGATATIQIVAKLVATTPGQQIVNTATVTAGVLDPVPANNTASANVGLPTLEPTEDADGDGLSNEFETKYGLDPFGGPGSGPNDDPDGDGKTNLQEMLEGTHPRGFVITYLAEGATGPFFDTRLAIANPTGQPALVLTRFQKGDGTTIRDYRVVPAMSRTTIDVEQVPGLEDAEFSTLVEADVQVVADRTMTWDDSGYGSHAERGILTRTATKWYFAEGATFGPFNLFYLIQNPNDQAAQVKVTYLLPTGAPLVKAYTVAPQSRFNIWVDAEGANDPALAPLAAAELSAVIESTNGVPIIAERAMYLDQPGRALGAGHESAGVTAPSTQWFLAEGATGHFFDLFVLIANPTDTVANVQADFLLSTGEVISKTYQVAANSRFNIWVDQEDPAIENVSVSTRIRSTNGVGIIVERAMWWPGPTSDTWQEAHNSPGETTTGTRWAMAEGELDGPRNVETYVLVANTSNFVGTIRATVLFDDGTAPISREYFVGANSRFNIAPAANDFFPETRGKKFGMIVESVGETPAQIVVERAMYSDAGDERWAAGTNALATKLQ